MSCFVKQQTAMPLASLDPGKHVNYVPGMILGVDDFTQEFAYLAGHDRGLAHEALGYGTLRGLAVAWRVDAGGIVQAVVEVCPGVAMTPCGRMVCVPRQQCADVNLWLKNHDADVSGRFAAGAVAGLLTLHVVLSFQDCLTDDTPIPGEPCRSADELMQPSRVTDSFLLDFAMEPPAGWPTSAPLQGEEDALRGFFAWLRAIPVDPLPGASSAADFENAVCGWVAGAAPPKGLSIPVAAFADYFARALRLWVTTLRPRQEQAAARVRFLAWANAVPQASGSTPASSTEELLAEARRWTPVTTAWRAGLAVDPAKKAEFISKATDLWVTDIGPGWYGNACGCGGMAGPAGGDDRVLLASVSFNVQKALGQPWQAVIPDATPGMPSLDQSARPILLHLRALQEAVTASAATSAVRMAVVAAGRMPLVQAPVPAPLTYGGLQVVKVIDGLVTFSFAGYQPPAVGNPDLVVKILGGSTGEKSEPAIRFKNFDADGFTLAITRSGKGVVVAKLAAITLHVEVTAIFPSA